MTPVESVLSRLPDAKRNACGWEARCPAHDDRDPSLSVREGEDGRCLLKCHAGCDTKDIVAKLGLRMADLFMPGCTGTNGTRASKDTKKRKWLSPEDFGESLKRKKDYQIVRVFMYTPDFAVVRLDADGRKKIVRPMHREGGLWLVGDPPKRPLPLFNLEAIPGQSRIAIAEGELKAQELTRLGIPCVTSAHGASSAASSDWSPLTDVRELLLFPDNNDIGERYVLEAARLICNTNTQARLKLIHLPGVPAGGDIIDWLKQRAGEPDGELRRHLEELIAAAPEYSLPPEVEPSTVAEEAANSRATTDAGNGATSPRILVATDEYRVIEETIGALTTDLDLYARGTIMVRVLRSNHPMDGIDRPEGSSIIAGVPTANLRERISRCASFYRIQNGQRVPAHVPPWLVNAIDARGEWPGIRPLVGISNCPILRPDGTVLQEPGYDPATGVLYLPAEGTVFPTIPDSVTLEDACRAFDSLTEIICDFRFETDAHRAAWLAGLLTALARFAFSGPSPLFLIDANVRGAGKGLMAQIIGVIVLGQEMPVSSYAKDPEEMRKKLTSIALAGDRMILFDNVEGLLGNDALDRALTSTRWKDRILGRSQEIELPLMPAWYATGNNVQVGADTCRRVIHIRLDVLEERPEARSDFRHPDLIGWVAQNRGRLLMDALTILVAYCQAGRPRMGLTPFGSFEKWSSLVRETLVWAGLPDPCLTQSRLAASSDTTSDTLGQLLEAMSEYEPMGKGFVCSTLLRELYGEPRPMDECSVRLRMAIEALVECSPGRVPTAGQLGNRLKQYRRRVISGRYLDMESVRTEHGARWRIRTSSDRVSQSQSEHRVYGAENSDFDRSTDSADSEAAYSTKVSGSVPF